MASESDKRTRDRILHQLQTQGPQSTAQLARHLGLTSVGVRQHLARLDSEGCVAWKEDRRGRVGRPPRTWSITPLGRQGFPEGYGDLAADLLSAAEAAFGAEGLAGLVAERAHRQARRYQAQMPGPDASLARRLAALARIREEEGHMVEWRVDADAVGTLAQNHCPIGAVAQRCRELCACELRLFQGILGEDVRVERTEHILDGSRRCLYRIQPICDPVMGDPRLPHPRPPSG